MVHTPPPAQMDLPITWDDANTVYGVAGFSGCNSSVVTDPTDASNTVAQTIKTRRSSNLGWCCTWRSRFSNPIPFVSGATTMSARIWSSTPGTPMRMKVEDANDGNIAVETEVLSSVTNDWEWITFDFANQAGTPAIDFNNTYDKVVIFYNFGVVPSADETYYTDDIVFGNPPALGCNHSFNMYDSYGDGWDGTFADILVNGNVVSSGATGADLGGFGNSGPCGNVLFTANTGDVITLAWTTGGFYDNEISWDITDVNGSVISSGLYSTTAGGNGNCSNCLPPSLAAASNITPNSVDLAWTAGGTETM